MDPFAVKSLINFCRVRVCVFWFFVKSRQQSLFLLRLFRVSFGIFAGRFLVVFPEVFIEERSKQYGTFGATNVRLVWDLAKMCFAVVNWACHKSSQSCRICGCVRLVLLLLFCLFVLNSTCYIPQCRSHVVFPLLLGQSLSWFQHNFVSPKCRPA